MWSREVPNAPSILSNDANQDTWEAMKRKLPNTEAMKTYSHKREARTTVRSCNTTELTPAIIQGAIGHKGKTSHTVEHILATWPPVRTYLWRDTKVFQLGANSFPLPRGNLGKNIDGEYRQFPGERLYTVLSWLGRAELRDAWGESDQTPRLPLCIHSPVHLSEHQPDQEIGYYLRSLQVTTSHCHD